MEVPVSVIIPCYCCANTIARAIVSVDKQTSRPAEVILVDDASPDNSLAIMEDLQDNYAPGWIKIIRLLENRGPSFARNMAWEAATQPYIAFLDSDDAWHPKKLQIQYSYMSSNSDVVLTAHPCVITSAYTDFCTTTLPATLETTKVSKYLILLSNRLFTPCVMVKRDIGQRFSSHKRYCEDYLLWMQIILEGGTVVILNQPLAALFKNHFGQSGLSAHLWQMEYCELANYREVWEEGYICFAEMCFFCVVSLLKFLRRLLIQLI